MFCAAGSGVLQFDATRAVFAGLDYGMGPARERASANVGSGVCLFEGTEIPAPFERQRRPGWARGRTSLGTAMIWGDRGGLRDGFLSVVRI